MYWQPLNDLSFRGITRVVLGTHDLRVVDNGNIRTIQQRYKHPSYETPGTGKDIMLLKVSTCVRCSLFGQIIYFYHQIHIPAIVCNNVWWKNKYKSRRCITFCFLILCFQLSKKARLDNRVQTIPLPTSEINIKDNSKCRVAGWGKTTTGGGAVDELRVVDVSIINLQVCEKQWPGLPANLICAGGYDTNKGFCQVSFLSVYRRSQLEKCYTC